MKKLLLFYCILILLICAPHSVFAQTGNLSGQVFDASIPSTIPPMVAFNINVSGNDYGAMTGPSGDYSITGVPIGIHTVTATFSPTDIVTVTGVVITDGVTTELDFVLNRDSFCGNTS